MALDLEEQEQLDEFKAWWKQNGKWVLGAAALFVMAAGGWRAWQGWSGNQSAQAFDLFYRATQAAGMGDAKTAKELSGKIMDDYGRSGYAVPAAWLAAKINFDGGDLKSAQAQYQYALDHAGDPGMKELAKLRLAAVLLDQKDFAGALKQLDGTHDDAFASLFANLKGDILSAEGKGTEAREAYKLALDKLDPKSPLKNVIEVKLASLGG